MAQLTVSINGREYEISCDDGEEEHLMGLAQSVGHRVDELVTKVGQVGDARLLVLASLLLADELFEVRSELDVLNDKTSEINQNGFGPNDLELIATRIEGIAEVLEDN